MLGDVLGLQTSMGLAAACCALLALRCAAIALDHTVASASADGGAAAGPGGAGAGVRRDLAEVARAHPGDDALPGRAAPTATAFLLAMEEVQHVRGRAGALDWRLYEDVAHPEGWLEVWSMQNWTDHLREAVRLSDEDRQVLAQVAAFHDSQAPAPCRYLARRAGVLRGRNAA